MQLFLAPSVDGGKAGLALISDSSLQTTSSGVGTAGLEPMQYIASSSGRHGFWQLLTRSLEFGDIEAVAVSLNSNVVFDDELPVRLAKACAGAAGGAKWAVLASTGKCVNGMVCSVVYPSASPRLFALNIPQPIVDCGLEFFVISADFLRATQEVWLSISMEPESFAQWCILQGYLTGRLSVFRPELAIGIDGAETGRDLETHVDVMRNAFAKRLPDQAIPSLMGELPLKGGDAQIQPPAADRSDVRKTALARPVVPLLDMIRELTTPVATPMSLSIVTRTTFSREHLLRRMLSTLTRARHELDIKLEVVLSTDIDAEKARAAHETLQAEFRELTLLLQINNEPRYPHSRVNNLMGGIMAARNDYVAVIDDDDFVDMDALRAIADARFLGADPLLVMSSQVRSEKWREAGNARWHLESSSPANTYYSDNIRYMFKGVNQLPVCALISPRRWMQDRLRELPLRHDLSEDYAIFLALLCAPDLPPFLTYPDFFCLISSRNDESNTVNMVDRRPWVRDITLFLHDLFVAAPILGAGGAQMMAQTARIPDNAAADYLRSSRAEEKQRRARELALLKAEVAHLRELIAGQKAAAEVLGGSREEDKLRQAREIALLKAEVAHLRKFNAEQKAEQ